VVEVIVVIMVMVVVHVVILQGRAVEGAQGHDRLYRPTHTHVHGAKHTHEERQLECL
jgi:hypothetical protein